jgi:hypothetical protein
LVFAGGRILSGDPTATVALEPVTSAEANNRALRVETAVVDAAPGHGIDFLRIRYEDVLRRHRFRNAGDDRHRKG